ncbi:hypothetical protein B0H14DRAFT_2812807 [Mycena olivaceomarginata]|nr:hypothetical protein B0H14DRAFT_2812807 [Mycena olivaceomarginata]
MDPRLVRFSRIAICTTAFPRGASCVPPPAFFPHLYSGTRSKDSALEPLSISTTAHCPPASSATLPRPGGQLKVLSAPIQRREMRSTMIITLTTHIRTRTSSPARILKSSPATKCLRSVWEGAAVARRFSGRTRRLSTLRGRRAGGLRGWWGGVLIMGR